MFAKGWKEGAILMHKWFNNPPSGGAIDTTTIKMEWVLGFPLAKKVYDSIFSEQIYINGPAQLEIKKLLQFLGKDQGGVFNFHLPVTQLDPKYYINYKVVDAVPLTKDLDGLSAALGKFPLRVVVGGNVQMESGMDMAPDRFKVNITDVGVYIRDSFDFEGSQPLGCWNVCTGEVGKANCGGGEYVSNKDFRDWRDKNGKGGDFLVYSDVKAQQPSSPASFYL